MRPHIMIRFALSLAAAWTPVVTHAQTAAPSKLQAPWTVPRTPDGRPDLQGNWSNATLTSFERPAGLPLVLTKAQVAQLEKVRSDTIEKLGQRSDPNRTAPPVGGDGSTGAAGNVGGYNYFWIDAGDHIAVVNGEPRSSMITNPQTAGSLPSPPPDVPGKPSVSSACDSLVSTTIPRTVPSPSGV